MRIYNASSSEMFGDTGGKPADEMTAFRPHSHYGVSKASAHWFVEGYRNGYGLFACSGIAFNHESPLRSERFVTQKIVRAAVEIKCGSSNRLKLGNTSIVRDWGWAPEYADAMWRMLQRDAPADFVLATGIPSSLEEFIAASFGHLGLDWRNHVDRDGAFMRPYELAYSVGNAAKAARELKWKATVTMPGLVASLVEGELERSSA
jgi:GDPmannose 4,6-dehydratase